MKLRFGLCVGLLGAGMMMSPALTFNARGDDAPKKEQPKEGETPKRGPLAFLDRFRATVDKLEITAEQKPKIDAAFADARSKIDAAMKEAAGDREALGAKMKPILKELTMKVVEALTPEQKEKLEKIRKEGGRRSPAGNNAN